MNEIKALATLDKTVLALGSKKPSAKAKANPCAAYNKIKPGLPAIMFLLMMIPGIGKKIVAVMQVVIDAAEGSV